MSEELIKVEEITNVLGLLWCITNKSDISSKMQCRKNAT